MNQSLLRLISIPRVRPLLAASALFAVAAAPQAQNTSLVIDDFEDGDLSEYGQFAGEEGSVLTTTDMADGAFALQFATDADDYGGSAGFFRALPGAPYDLGALDNAYLVFDLEVTAPLTLEINFQDGDGQTGGEIRNALVFGAANGGYQSYALPLFSFFNTRTATAIDLSDVRNIVFTVINATGDGDSATTETVLRLDNLRLGTGATLTDVVVFDNLDDGDYSEYFSYSGGEFPELSPTTETSDGSANALRGRIDADEYGNFAGFGKTFDSAPVDVSAAETLNFLLRTNGAGKLEINIQSGVADASQGVQSQSRETIAVADTDGEYIAVSIPLEAFIQTTAQPADLTGVFNLAFTFVELQTADMDPATTEFVFDLDNITFGTGDAATAISEIPDVFSTAPSVFPNPTVGRATVAFDLAAPSDVSVDVVDMLGRRVAQIAEAPRSAGEVRLALPTDGLAPGLYVVRVRTSEGMASTRLVLTR